jgi:hypothetical protein
VMHRLRALSGATRAAGHPAAFRTAAAQRVDSRYRRQRASQRGCQRSGFPAQLRRCTGSRMWSSKCWLRRLHAGPAARSRAGQPLSTTAAQLYELLRHAHGTFEPRPRRPGLRAVPTAVQAGTARSRLPKSPSPSQVFLQPAGAGVD